MSFCAFISQHILLKFWLHWWLFVRSAAWLISGARWARLSFHFRLKSLLSAAQNISIGDLVGLWEKSLRKQSKNSDICSYVTLCCNLHFFCDLRATIAIVVSFHCFEVGHNHTMCGSHGMNAQNAQRTNSRGLQPGLRSPKLLVFYIWIDYFSYFHISLHWFPYLFVGGAPSSGEPLLTTPYWPPSALQDNIHPSITTIYRRSYISTNQITSIYSTEFLYSFEYYSFEYEATKTGVFRLIN